MRREGIACLGIASRFTSLERKVQQRSHARGNRRDKTICLCGCYIGSISEDGAIMDIVRADDVEGKAAELSFER